MNGGRMKKMGGGMMMKKRDMLANGSMNKKVMKAAGKVLKTTPLGVLQGAKMKLAKKMMKKDMKKNTMKLRKRKGTLDR
jgi:hypothetical protein